MSQPCWANFLGDPSTRTLANCTVVDRTCTHCAVDPWEIVLKQLPRGSLQNEQNLRCLGP